MQTQDTPRGVQNPAPSEKQQNMKKNYISPLATEVNIGTTNMLAASLAINNNTTVDTSNGGQLTGGHRGTWGNLWQ